MRAESESSSDPQWVTVETYPFRHMAEVAGSALRAAGIPFRVMADDAGGAAGIALGGADVVVPASRHNEARDVLKL